MVQATFNETLPGAKAGMDPKEANKAEQERLALNEQLKAEGKPQIPGTSLASGTTSKNPSGAFVVHRSSPSPCVFMHGTYAHGSKFKPSVLTDYWRADYATSGGPGGQGNKPVENPTF